MKNKLIILMFLLPLALVACKDDKEEDMPSNDKTPSGLEAVDLGLPSGLKWANMNLGAQKAEDTGLFFPWGEIEGYTDADTVNRTFDFTTYKLANGDFNSLTKYSYEEGYGVVDNKWTLDLEDDAANVAWGEGWRLPSQADANELLENCDYVWTTQNGVLGGLFTSKINGKQIFIPGIGYLNGTSYKSKDILGHYWCNCLYKQEEQSSDASMQIHPPFAGCYFFFFKNGKTGIGKAGRNGAFPVRPVKEK